MVPKSGINNMVPKHGFNKWYPHITKADACPFKCSTSVAEVSDDDDATLAMGSGEIDAGDVQAAFDATVGEDAD